MNKRDSIIERIGFLNGQIDMAYKLSVWEHETCYVTTTKIPYAEFVKPIIRKRKIAEDELKKIEMEIMYEQYKTNKH